nr:hypothetical protein [Tanacetum cinerariifolium]
SIKKSSQTLNNKRKSILKSSFTSLVHQRANEVSRQTSDYAAFKLMGF